jgi:hypothetical protein
MQSLHPHRGTIQEYLQELSDPSRYRPDHCPLCQGRDPLRAHGFYCRTLIDVNYDGAIPVRRYLCLLRKRTVSLLPEFALPYLRFSIQVIGLFLVSRLLDRRTLREAAALRLYSHGRNDHSHRAGIDHPHRRNTHMSIVDGVLSEIAC